jgi:hypothetical protein
LIPPITAQQWSALPNSLLRAGLLLVYVPVPDLARAGSSLDTPDAGDAVEFLNRPYGVKFLATNGTETKVRYLLNRLWTDLLDDAAITLRWVIAGGVLSALLAVFIRPSIVLHPLFLIPLALMMAGVARAFLIALVDISSFPAVYHDRMFPADPLVAMSAILFFRLFASVVRSYGSARLSFF